MTPGNDDEKTAYFAAPQKIEVLQRDVAGLIVVQGAEIGRHVTIRRNSVVLGRTDDADIILKDKMISRKHARIAVSYDAAQGHKQYRLSDLESTNHIYVNGAPITERVLQNGDKIQLGDTIVKFEIQDKVDSQFHADIQRKIEYDDLTALLTYDSFKTALSWELENSTGTTYNFSVIMMDLDNFKRVNDTHGHLAGSFILQEIGRLIRENIRRFDVAARYGGEEFIAYLPETDKDEAFVPAGRLRKAIEDEQFMHDDTEIRITISMGISQYPEHGRCIDDLVRVADEKLYAAKQDGKNRVYVA